MSIPVKSMIIRKLVLLSGLGMLVVSCSSGIVGPPKGITGKFYRDADSADPILVGEYDFSRLQKGYGLVVFSYDFRGKGGNAITGFSPNPKAGMRVWEYKFRSTDWDVKLMEKKIMFWGYRSASALFLARNGFTMKMRMEFHKGRIVYGGHLVVDMAKMAEFGPAVQFTFDTDMKPWLQKFGNELAQTKIDTALIRLVF